MLRGNVYFECVADCMMMLPSDSKMFSVTLYHIPKNLVCLPKSWFKAVFRFQNKCRTCALLSEWYSVNIFLIFNTHVLFSRVNSLQIL